MPLPGQFGLFENTTIPFSVILHSPILQMNYPSKNFYY